eukprot:COSAG02_NODE_1605_length_11721_cov_163.467475_3_plen_378_part_00
MQFVRDTIGGLASSAAVPLPPREPELPAAAVAAPATLLVIQADDYDWKAIFAGARLRDGRTIRVVQLGWDRLLVTADSPAMSTHTACLVHVRPTPDGKGGGTIKPDFVLVRNEARGAVHTEDHRNALFGLMFAGLPAVNSLSSIYQFLERPIVQAELNRIQRRLGADEFPVVPQSYFATHHAMMYGGAFPAVLKVGHAHAGMGKMRVPNHHDWDDVRSVVAMTDGKYCTAEPFLEGDFDLRVQKLGRDHYRVFKRTAMSGNWKTNTGCSIVEELPLTAENQRYKRWADEASQLFGGLDICTVDVLVEAESGKEWILEVNGTSSGLSPEQAAEDNEIIRELTLERMNTELCQPRPRGVALAVGGGEVEAPEATGVGDA